MATITVKKKAVRPTKNTARAVVKKDEPMRFAKAVLASYNQSPRKVRLVTNLVKGKKVGEALATLAFLPKRASLPIKKLIESAVANAKQIGLSPESLSIKKISVDAGEVLVRFMPRAQGRATPIRRRRSQITVILG